MGTKRWGGIIQSIRKERGLSQRGLALKSGVNRNTLRRIEQGVTNGTVDVLTLLLKHLGHDLEAIPQNF
jgi:transcriptional regulator with XRE-family HTH domain